MHKTSNWIWGIDGVTLGISLVSSIGLILSISYKLETSGVLR